MRYVIIGGSIAGLSAAKAIREHDLSGEITVISGERSRPYYRPLIPLLISGEKSEDEILYPEDPLEGKNVARVLGTVVGVDAKKKEVLLASGERRYFDSLLIATGGAALKPPIPGIEGKGVHPLRSMVNALQIRNAAASSASAAVLGGGLVGIKAALALRKRGGALREVTVIEVLPQLLNGRLDRRGAALVRAAVEREGVTVLTGQVVSGIIRTPSVVSGVKLSSNRMIKADLVVVAAGAKPNVAYLRRAGIGTNRGVLVNESLETNISGIYAAGDVAEGTDLLMGTEAVSGLWSNALEMGRTAGINMAGGNVKYPGLMSVMNAAEIAGVPFISVGLIEPIGGRYGTVSHEDENGYWKLVFSGDFLVGAVFVGDLQKAGIYTSLIRNRIPISKVKNKVMKRTATYTDFLNP